MHIACLTLIRKLLHIILNVFDPCRIQTNRWNIRFREELVVHVSFLFPHQNRCFLRFIITTGCLYDFLSVFQQLPLTCHLCINRLLYIGNGIQIFDLGFGTKSFTALRTYGNIDITAHASLFHFNITDSKVIQHTSQLFHIGSCLCPVSDIRFTDDFHQRCSRTVVVYQCPRIAVKLLSGILFHMNTVDADILFPVIRFNGDDTVGADWMKLLGYLEALWKIGIIIVLAIKLHQRIDFTLQCRCGQNCQTHSILIYTGECSGMSQIHFIYTGVRYLSKGCRCP